MKTHITRIPIPMAILTIPPIGGHQLVFLENKEVLIVAIVDKYVLLLFNGMKEDGEKKMTITKFVKSKNASYNITLTLIIIILFVIYLGVSAVQKYLNQNKKLNDKKRNFCR